ncbi:type I polyketide synthase [Dactylosporangium sp. NPDC000555]|uniref:type I polyketide synthase n=1 Tax=Dactylosporangium sp. NPDC000555 TaxID=3154260 RepID=UPI003333C84F
MTRIAVVGMACRYPDAASPKELWENALAGRRAFRRLPDVRMRLDDYWDADPSTPDRFYARNAAVIEGYEFDRIAYKVAGSTYRSTDLTHWLALDMAAKALADAGFPMGEGLPRQRTGVVVGNTLTGEFSRANQLRLRWPYVRRLVASALKAQDWDDDQLATFLTTFEDTFKAPFPAVDEDTLAGGLSNTIAGRICNHFDLKGGGYTVDGACSSSLLSVATACNALIDGELDVAIAGGVDLSIDPFEIIGFAKTGALATGEMRVYDRASNGFWPGEGCGMVVLMREDEARRGGHRVYATVAGWGISSDGKGGITRPEIGGYRLALQRAYDRAEFNIGSVALFEGHGTGTKVGDTTELTALAQARADDDPSAPPAAIGSIKAMIGHTKAAAGVAGLIKASMAVHHEVLPPTLGCFDAHEVLAEPGAPLRMLRKAEPWPAEGPIRAGITAMGFGGINTHIVLENPEPRRRVRFDTRLRALSSSLQDVELLAVDADSAPELRERLERLATFVATVAYAELGDLAATLHRELADRPWRAAVIASSPEHAERQARAVMAAIDEGRSGWFGPDGRAFLGLRRGPARVGFLFPGQGSGRGVTGGALRRRFAEAEEVYAKAALPTGADAVATEVAQPRIVTGAIAGMRTLSALGIEAAVAVGHSLGELAALHWAGAFDEETLLRTAALRGQTMARHSASGTMAGIAAGPDAVREILADLPVVVAGYNGPQQTVVAGPVDAIDAVCAAAARAGHTATRLNVSHAFHSPLVADAADAFAAVLDGDRFGPVRRRVVSTVTGRELDAGTDLVELLRTQITEPVQFAQALAAAVGDVDLFVEVGPGRVLSGLAAEATGLPAVALDTDDESLAGLLRVVAAAFVVGAADIDPALFHGRLIRPLQIGAEFRFFASPCESAPILPLPARAAATPAASALPVAPVAPVTIGGAAAANDGESTLQLLRRLAAQRAELPVELVHEGSRLLDDLHLSSITVGQVVNQVAQEIGVPPAQTPVNFATATVQELATALDEIGRTGRPADAAVPDLVGGVGDWVRAWSVDLDELPVPARPAPGASGRWHAFADGGHPLAEPLRRALERAGVGSGVLVCLPDECPEEKLELALAGARAALAGEGIDRFVLVQRGRGAAGLAKTLHLEAPHLRTTVVDVPGVPEAVDWVVTEVAATTAMSEVRYDAEGVRRVPTLRVLPVEPARPQEPLSAGDVILVTGGGKGITTECALSLAVRSGARLALIGRSDPEQDRELAGNLGRIADAGVVARYARADVTDPQRVRAAIEELTGELGPVTVILHGAGRNEPAAVTSVSMATVRETMAPKIDGLRHVIDAVEPAQLRLLVTLGSIIGRAGLRGEAHYATANEWLVDLTEELGRKHPNCRTLCMEWSVWAGVGMGERLSVVSALSRDGITPITPDQGVRMLWRLLSDPDAPPVVVISGRTEGIHTVRYDQPPLPLLRFVERPLVRYHGVELVAEIELNAGTDPYLADHELDGNLLFPAVFGMEAMAQVAGAATARTTAPVIEQAEFLRPIVVPVDGSTTVRVAALVRDDETVDVVIHSAETSFAAEHFRARLRYAGHAEHGADDPAQAPPSVPPVPLDPAADLYGGTLFQGARFQRLRGYHRAAARDVDADVEALGTAGWFAPYLPGGLLLGDPGVRDALMHGNQVCVPDGTLLPAGIERVEPAGDRLVGTGMFRYCATERSRDGDEYVYDIVLRTPAGEIVERWLGLRLRAVRRTDGAGPWVAPLLGPYLERSVDELLGVRVAIAVEPDEPDAGAATDHVAARRARTALAATRALGHPATIQYRPDGRPELDGDRTLSASHGAGLTLAAVAPGVLGCDVQVVTGRPAQQWAQMLGSHHSLADLVATVAGEPADTAAARVWAAIECLQKAGRPTSAPLVLRPQQRIGWTVFSSGSLRVAVFATTVRGVAEPVVFAVLTEGGR